jgi:ABC-type lipoprotein release transport system permease subunit
MNRTLVLFLFILLANVVGCKDETKQTYANVSGTVTYNGKPLDKGEITFAVAGYPPTTSPITDGKFAGQAIIGSNKIMVSAKKKGNAASAKGISAKEADKVSKGYMQKLQQEGGGPPADYDPSQVEYIPADWNTDSKHTRVVESGAPNTFQFDIKGK